MRVLADESKVSQLIDDMAAAIAKDMADVGSPSQWALVGVRSRGDDLARRLAAKLEADRVGTLDITLYRDDLSEIGSQPVVRTTEIPFAIDGLHIVVGYRAEQIREAVAAWQASKRHHIENGRGRWHFPSAAVRPGGCWRQALQAQLREERALAESGAPGFFEALARGSPVGATPRVHVGACSQIIENRRQ